MWTAPFCWKDESDEYARCHWEGYDWDIAPCEEPEPEEPDDLDYDELDEFDAYNMFYKKG